MLARQGRAAREKRRQIRAAVSLKARIYIPGRESEEVCEVIDFSPDGAGLKGALLAPVGTLVVLYIEGFGRFEGAIVQRGRTRFGVQFKNSGNKRLRVAEQIATFLANGTAVGPEFRSASRMKRIPVLSKLVGSDGVEFDCEIADIALGGAALKTSARPPVGSLVKFGSSTGHVVRHTAEGIAIQFRESLTPPDGH